MTIKKWPSDKRPREKLIKQGPASLSDAELLAIFIKNGLKGHTALDISHDLFIQFGNWNSIMQADEKIFCNVRGLGIAKYAELKAISEVNQRCAKELLVNNNILKDTHATYRYLLAKMKDYHREVFACLFLNSANHLITFEELFYGTVTMASIYPREVIKAALACNAVGAIAVHNHPSGQITPSEADIEVTHQLKKALDMVEVCLLDHIIIGKGLEVTSFREQGLL